jgi:hypothetical protein
LSRHRILSRLVGLEVRNQVRRRAAIAAKVAERYGLDAGELLAGTEQIAKEFLDAGLVTFEQELAFVANEMGITTGELQREIDDLLAACP